MRKTIATGALTLVILTAGATPALARHGGDHAPRPSAPPEPRGLYQSGQIDCMATYPNGPTAPPVFVCSEDQRPEQAAFPDTGPQNRSNSPQF